MYGKRRKSAAKWLNRSAHKLPFVTTKKPGVNCGPSLFLQWHSKPPPPETGSGEESRGTLTLCRGPGGQGGQPYPLAGLSLQGGPFAVLLTHRLLRFIRVGHGALVAFLRRDDEAFLCSFYVSKDDGAAVSVMVAKFAGASSQLRPRLQFVLIKCLGWELANALVLKGQKRASWEPTPHEHFSAPFLSYPVCLLSSVSLPPCQWPSPLPVVSSSFSCLFPAPTATNTPASGATTF